MEIRQLKQETDLALAAGDVLGAWNHLTELWRRDAGQASAAFLLSRLPSLRPHLALTPHKLAILRSFTVEPMAPLLRASAACAGIDLEIHIGEFNAYPVEILDEGSALYQFAPQTVILAVRTPDVAPELWAGFGEQNDAALAAVERRVCEQFASWIEAFRRNSDAHLIIHNLELPAQPVHGLLDAQGNGGQCAAIARINTELRRLAASFRGVWILDYEALTARHGKDHWYDARKWLSARLPVSAPCLMHLVREWMRFLHPITGKVAKALVVDLDNTLWGGVIGEDGMSGIRVGPEHPGAPYWELQRAILDISRRGILLAVASKNNPDDALQALADHPGMLLRPEHFACLRINWNDKSTSLEEIASELNIGVDALALLDDNPVEREQVRARLPQVMVLEPPEDPIAWASFLRDQPILERLNLSEEDRQRNQYYAAERRRQEVSQRCNTPEDFYRQLDQEMEISGVTPLTLARSAQLTQKTNQFNLTTRRYTEQQIAAFAASEDRDVFTARVTDRFADNGIVGLAVLHYQGNVAVIDTFLLSCRVIGRTVETALLSFLAQRAIRRGASYLEGWFLPTKKNAPARDFYPRHGFQLMEETEAGSRWRLALADGQATQCPPWIRLKVGEGVAE